MLYLSHISKTLHRSQIRRRYFQWYLSLTEIAINRKTCFANYKQTLIMSMGMGMKPNSRFVMQLYVIFPEKKKLSVKAVLAKIESCLCFVFLPRMIFARMAIFCELARHWKRSSMGESVAFPIMACFCPIGETIVKSKFFGHQA